MIYYALQPITANVREPRIVFEAHDFGASGPSSVIAQLLAGNYGPVHGWLTELDMSRLKGMLEAGALMNGCITLEADPQQLGMLKIFYENLSFSTVFHRSQHDQAFKFSIIRGMHVEIQELPKSAIEWQQGQPVTEIVRFDSTGQPVDIPGTKEGPRTTDLPFQKFTVVIDRRFKGFLVAQIAAKDGKHADQLCRYIYGDIEGEFLILRDWTDPMRGEVGIEGPSHVANIRCPAHLEKMKPFSYALNYDEAVAFINEYIAWYNEVNK
jgi:hypothetical protein